MENSRSEDSKIKILIIEDQEDDLEILQFQLDELKMPTEVTAFPTGEQALSYLGELTAAGSGLPHLVILDLFLPGEDGLQILEKIKNEPAWSKLPVIILSNAKEQEYIRQSYRKGGVTFLPKPCKAHQLKDVISQLHITGLLNR